MADAGSAQPRGALEDARHGAGIHANDASDIVAQNRRVNTPFMIEKSERNAAKAWDKFYKAHQDRFFKDRHWTDREFAELRSGGDTAADEHDRSALEATLSADTPVLLEVGCGVGNTVYPLLEKNAALRVHCCDFSPRAVGLVRVRVAATAGGSPAVTRGVRRRARECIRI